MRSLRKSKRGIGVPPDDNEVLVFDRGGGTVDLSEIPRLDAAEAIVVWAPEQPRAAAVAAPARGRVAR